MRLSNAIGSLCARLVFSSKRFRRQLKLAAGVAHSYRHFRGRFSLEECSVPLCENRLPSTVALYRPRYGPVFALSPQNENVWSRGVAQWFRWSLSVADPFVSRCLTSSAMLPFPHPAHRTGRADLPHPALGEDSRNGNGHSHCL